MVISCQAGIFSGLRDIVSEDSLHAALEILS